MLQKNLKKHVKQICEGEKYDFRADTLRVRLIRLAKKIPLFLLHHLHSKSKYKSNSLNHFREAYLNTYKRFLQLLEIQNIENYSHWDKFDDLQSYPPEFLEFCALHYPRSKVEELAGWKVDYVLRRLLMQRNKTSLKGFIKLSKINRVLFQTLKLMQKAACGELNPKAQGIIFSFLRNEKEFFDKKCAKFG